MNARFHEMYKKEICPLVKKELGFKSVMQVPKLEKIVLSMGAGSYFADSAKMEQAMQALTYIAGQKACYRQAKKSIATFKVREGMKTGIMVTLRGNRMYEFMDRLRNIVLPRIRDFRGFDEKSINGKAFSMGMKDYLVFPEVREFLKNTDSVGLNITFVVNKEDPAAFKALMLGFGFPFSGPLAGTTEHASSGAFKGEA